MKEGFRGGQEPRGLGMSKITAQSSLRIVQVVDSGVCVGRPDVSGARTRGKGKLNSETMDDAHEGHGG